MIKIKSDFSNGAVAIPTDLIDKYLKLAPSASFKVLLFILRNPNGVLDEKQISLCTGLSEIDVKDCIEFWVENDVVFFDGEENKEEADKASGNLKQIKTLDYEESEAKPKVVVKNLPVKKPTQRELALRISEDENLTEENKNKLKRLETDYVRIEFYEMDKRLECITDKMGTRLRKLNIKIWNESHELLELLDKIDKIEQPLQ